jgi:nucleotide-binding universal stress UspA family protein
MYAKILVPVDFSACSKEALRHARAIAEAVGGEVVLLHVAYGRSLFHGGVGSTSLSAADEAELREQAEADLAELAREFDPEGRLVRAREVAEGDARDAILEAARARGADLIVMGTHGRSGVARRLLGSVAESVVRHAGCPVLVVREGA